MGERDVPALRPADRFGPDEPAVLPCLVAARGLGLTLRYSPRMMRLSQYPDEGWWGRKDYGASMDLGGPWSVEFVFRLCELGLISLDPQTATRAMLTKAGKAFLRERTRKIPSAASADVGSAQAPKSNSEDVK